MKLKKIATYVLAPIPTILTVGAMAYFLYYVSEKTSGQRAAITFAIIITVVAISILSYAVYDVRIKHRGESMSALMDRQTKQMMKLSRPKVLAIFLFPILLPLFASIYSTALLLMLWLLCLPLGDFCDQWPKVISLTELGISIFFAVGTCIWLWKQMKRMYPEKAKHNIKLTE